ncbi:MAG TPA: SRPBCC family protein [Gaiellaceae bacterium]|nr:SRPBCC family protein [Gaiellaceae bacterium]
MANGNGHEGAGATRDALVSALKSKEVLVPAALSAAGTIVASKGPDLLHRLTDATERKGENEAEELGEKAAEGAKAGLRGKGGLAGKALAKALPGGGSGGKKTRRLPIQRWTDVAVSVDKAYEAWTEFNDFPKFMHRVLNVRQKGDDRVSWQEKIWFSTRQWEGRITDRRKNDRIAWKTTSGMSHRGVVSFHRLDDNLTRVMVTMEFEPNGMVEKMASGLRFVKRAVQSDLARFKAYVELKDARGIEYRPADSERRDDGSRRGSSGEDRDQEREARRKSREERRETVEASS